jgi:hypothetical protein
MKIGIINIEPKVFNTAYMQIAHYYRKQGDTVDWYNPLMDGDFDHVYCSSLFTFTNMAMVPKRAICGGTGIDVTSRLSQAIEASDLDYSIYPKCEKSFLRFSRGCIRDCPFCVVRQKEGIFRAVEPKNLNPNGKIIVVCDNNFCANKNWRGAVLFLNATRQHIKFEGIDVRTLNKNKCQALNKMRIKRGTQIAMAWDDPRENLVGKFKEATEYIKPWKISCYVLIGYWSTEAEDLYRVETLRGLGIDPFVMPYNKKDPYQKCFARWVNVKSEFYSSTWQQYKQRKELITWKQ